MKIPVIDRIANKTIFGQTCWTWFGATGSSGRYGLITVSRNEGHKHVHRVVYEYVFESAEGMEVCHTCDNGLCVNPFHLVLGTHEDNMADMVFKGRSKGLKGEANKKAKLTIEQVKQIREQYLNRTHRHWGRRKLARSLGVSETQINYIILRKPGGWAHVD